MSENNIIKVLEAMGAEKYHSGRYDLLLEYLGEDVDVTVEYNPETNLDALRVLFIGEYFAGRDLERCVRVASWENHRTIMQKLMNVIFSVAIEVGEKRKQSEIKRALSLD